MPTNLHDNGDYPIRSCGMEDVEFDAFPSFDTLWREEFSLIPEAPNDWKEREVFRAFAKKVYERSMFWEFAQNVANMAYNDGYDDGIESARKNARTLAEKLRKDVEDL